MKLFKEYDMLRDLSWPFSRREWICIQLLVQTMVRLWTCQSLFRGASHIAQGYCFFLLFVQASVSRRQDFPHFGCDLLYQDISEANSHSQAIRLSIFPYRMAEKGSHSYQVYYFQLAPSAYLASLWFEMKGSTFYGHGSFYLECGYLLGC